VTGTVSPAEPVVMPAGGEVIRGPSALSGGWKRFLSLTRTLAVQEFKLKFFGSVLGYAWQLMRPLMLFGVLYVVFSVIVRLGDAVPHYPVMLLTAIVLFTFYAEATSSSVSAVVDRENLVRKIHFPRLVIPMAVVMTAVFNLMVNLVAVAIFALVSGVQPRTTWLLFPLVLLVLTVLVMGTATLLSALFVRYRDVRPIWDVVLQMTFYGSPIIYPIELVLADFPRLGQAMMCSPFGALIQQARHWLFDPDAPTPAEVLGADWRLVIPIGLGVAIVAAGLWVFNREAPRIAEEL
jgi:ABC-2 type transport system permease protein